jgi:hypothetical protein
MTTYTMRSRPTVDAILRPGDSHPTARVVGAALLFGVSYIHLADQGFFAFDKQPAYLLVSYLLVEMAAPVAAIALMRYASVAAWLVAVGCAAGPMVGYILTRSTGLPGAREDIGNWGEPIGVASLVVEGTLLLLAALEAYRLHNAQRSMA